MPARQLSNPADTEVMDLVLDFAAKLTNAVDRAALTSAKSALDLQLGPPPARGNGQGRGKAFASVADARAAMPGLFSATKPRKKPPLQLCPVPGCKNPAAPVYGMVCGEHKDMPKGKIKKYREQRRAAAERTAKTKAKK